MASVNNAGDRYALEKLDEKVIRSRVISLRKIENNLITSFEQPL